MKLFKTIKEEAFAEFIEKRSKFLCYANHIKSQDEAKHTVYAYRVKNDNIGRASDDGEPQGTAGIPILKTLENINIENVVVVVTRYFGGILLGTGGLTRAYSHGANLVIKECNIVEMRPCIVARIKFTYEIFDKIKKMAETLGAFLSECTYTNFVEAMVSVEDNKFDEFKEIINKLSCGNAEINIKKRDFLCVDKKINL